MIKFFTLMAAFLCLMSQAWADKVVGSTTLPENGRPEHLYTMRNANGLICGKTTSPTANEDNYASSHSMQWMDRATCSTSTTRPTKSG